MLATDQADQFLSLALDAAETGGACRDGLDDLPVPVYMTDAEGLVTYWNQACVAFAGRKPQLGRDRWCVTWRLYTMNGDPLRHDQCPMAVAIRRGEPIRDEIAIAERPSGHRVAFRPYPTPLLAADGSVTGAINMLIDITDEQCGALSDQASRCRRLAHSTTDPRAARILSDMAKGYEKNVAALRTR